MMRVALGLVLVLISNLVLAVESAAPSPTLERAMQRFGGAIKVEAWFKGPGNLVGVAAKFNGQPMVFFTDPEGRYMVTGMAIDVTSGRNLIAEATAQYFSNFGLKADNVGPLPAPIKSSLELAELKPLAFVKQGSAKTGKVAYVLFDFGCNHCMALYNAIGSKQLSGEIRWLPIAMSGEAAASKAALALGLGKMDSVLSLEGGSLKDSIAKNKSALGRGALLLEKNMQFVQDRNITSTPRFIYEKAGVLVEHDGFSSTDQILEALGVQ